MMKSRKLIPWKDTISKGSIIPYAKTNCLKVATVEYLKEQYQHEVAPNKPFFTTKAKGITTPGPSTCVSLGKTNLRSECIQQLDKWYDLKVRGIITEDQYKEFQETILSDMKKF